MSRAHRLPGFYTSAPSRCIRGMNGWGRSPLFFLIPFLYFPSLESFRRARDAPRVGAPPSGFEGGDFAFIFSEIRLQSIVMQGRGARVAAP